MDHLAQAKRVVEGLPQAMPNQTQEWQLQLATLNALIAIAETLKSHESAPEVIPGEVRQAWD